MRIDLIALDLDGTLLDPSENVSQANRAAIRLALEGGIRVVLVTGRGVDLPIRVSRELNLNLPVICCHGALIKDFQANRTLYHLPVPMQYAKPMVDFAMEHSLSVALYAEESFWRIEGSHVYMDDMTGPAWREVPSFDVVLASGAPTFMRFLGEPTVERMLAEFGDWPLNFRRETWFDFVECAVLNRDASKRTALARFCGDFQIASETVLAIGDSRNDVPMLRWAGVGVAMGNASDEVKQSVRYVTASNTEDGVALALERFISAPRKKLA
jgi:Cof subfamily protein (haloacid dehalogenase superfamily)